MEVRVVSRKLIKPSVPTPSQLRNLKLSCIDQLAPAVYGSLIFFYPANNNMTVSEKDKRLNLLETSLSQILAVYYPLAGRYKEDSNSIDCNDQGAEYLKAQVHGQLAQFLEGKPEAELNRFIPFVNEAVGFSPTMLVVQVNVFDCGGLAINVNLSHKIADGYVVLNFIQAWATACRVGINEVVCPSFDMGSLLPGRDIKGLSIPIPENNGAKMVTKRFVFNGAAISTLKAKATAHDQDHSGFKHHHSRLQAVTALIWKARIDVAQAKHGYSRPSLLTLPFNFREKTTLKIPENSSGNVIKLVLAKFKPTESEVEFLDLVSLVGNAISSTAADYSRSEQFDDLFLLAISSMREIHEVLKSNKADICVFSSLCRFPCYEIDFGWGKPDWVSSVPKPTDMVLMMDTKCGGGIEAWVTLEEQEMIQFQQDQDIMAYTS